MSRMNPYIHAAGTAAEQLDYYKSVFGGETAVMTYGQMGATDETANLVMHGQLETSAGHTIMAADSQPGSPEFEGGTAISLSAAADEDGEELRKYWEALKDGASVVVDLQQQMWGDEYGQLVDKFGVRWHVNIQQSQQ